MENLEYNIISDSLYNDIISVYGESRIVMSGSLDLIFESKVQKNLDLDIPTTKPIGLWYGIGSSWIDWVRNEMPNLERDNLFLLDIDSSRIKTISNDEELLEFNDKYKWNDSSRYDLRLIDWTKVAKDYDGIEIVPYLHKMRLERSVFWYYGWDVASGCIWGDGVIKDIKKIS